jgi:hypothetical protein
MLTSKLPAKCTEVIECGVIDCHTDVIFTLSFAKNRSMQSLPLSATVVHSHAGNHSGSVSVRSTAGFWASSRRHREPSFTAAASSLQEEAQAARADAMGSFWVR